MGDNMSIWSTILDKLGLGKKTSTTGSVVRDTNGNIVTSIPRTSAASGAAVSAVDIAAKLDGLAKAWKGDNMDWKHSIVDLLKLLKIDSSFNNRKALATELGCPANLMGDSAAMNIWLHKTVMQKLAANGGNVPPELL
jgi:hypothetical protein